MNRDEITEAIQTRVGYLFGVPPVTVQVEWDLDRDKPVVRVPSRLQTVLFTPDQQRQIISQAIDTVLRQELHNLADTSELSDEELTSRLRARRG